MPRYKLTLEYDGTPFVGWQVQENGASVQGRLAEAIKAFSGEDVVPRGAGRTDAGVHALGQVAHFDLAKEWPDDKVRDALNAVLRPDPIAVLACEHRGRQISTRASPPKRATISIASSTGAARSRSNAMRAWGVFRPLDAKAMDEAAQVLVGHHDFTTFRSTECQAEVAGKDARPARLPRAMARSSGSRRRRAPSCTTRCAPWSARSSLSAKGSGVRQTCKRRLTAKDRARCGPVAPPHGLYLVRVDY